MYPSSGTGPDDGPTNEHSILHCTTAETLYVFHCCENGVDVYANVVVIARMTYTLLNRKVSLCFCIDRPRSTTDRDPTVEAFHRLEVQLILQRHVYVVVHVRENVQVGLGKRIKPFELVRF